MLPLTTAQVCECPAVTSPLTTHPSWFVCSTERDASPAYVRHTELSDVRRRLTADFARIASTFPFADTLGFPTVNEVIILRSISTPHRVGLGEIAQSTTVFPAQSVSGRSGEVSDHVTEPALFFKQACALATPLSAA
jgi:hypothetical protein